MKCHCCRDVPIDECLKDAGCSDEMIEEVVKCIQENDDERKVMILKRYRCHLLDNIHSMQKKLDCLDYLLYKMKKEK